MTTDTQEVIQARNEYYKLHLIWTARQNAATALFNFEEKATQSAEFEAAQRQADEARLLFVEKQNALILAIKTQDLTK